MDKNSIVYKEFEKLNNGYGDLISKKDLISASQKIKEDAEERLEGTPTWFVPHDLEIEIAVYQKLIDALNFIE